MGYTRHQTDITHELKIPIGCDGRNKIAPLVLKYGLPSKGVKFELSVAY